MLASLLFPYDDDAKDLMPVWLDELEREGCVRRYKVGGDTYMEVCNWLIHQKIDKPSQSKIPPFDEGSAIPREDSRILPVGPRTKDQGKDQGEDQEEDRDGTSAGAPVADATDKVAKVFKHWQDTMGKQRAVLDDKRKRLIRARLKDGYSERDLMTAITGYSLSPFHMGLNDKGIRYDGLDLILRDGSKVDQGLAFAQNPPKPMTRRDQERAANQAQLDDWVNGLDDSGAFGQPKDDGLVIEGECQTC